MNSVPLQGGCLCGAIRFSAKSTPFSALACHCRDCQRYVGGAPAYQLTFRRDDVVIEKGEPKRYRKTGDSGRGLERLFCGDCGTPLFTDLEKIPGLMVVNAGAFDDASGLKVTAHIFCASAPPWHQYEPGAIRHDGDFPMPPRKQ